MPYVLVIGLALLGGLCHFFAQETKDLNAAAFYYTWAIFIIIADRFGRKK